MDDKYYLARTFSPRLFPLKKNDGISVGQVFIESALDAPCSFFAIFQSQVVKPISQKSIFESTWMESYSLALQLQAAQEVVSEKMPRRALVVKLLLFTEVASALLMVQLGQFTHAGLIAVPFFLTSLVAIQREHWTQSIHLPDPSSVLLSVLSAKNYSMFGLRRRQEGIRTYLATTIFLRILCLVPLAVTLNRECENPKCLFHRCDPWGTTPPWQLISQQAKDRPPECEWPARWDLKKKLFSDDGDRFTGGALPGVKINPVHEWCERNAATLPKVWKGAKSSLFLWPNSNVSGLCSEELKLIPAMARHTCIAGTWDPILYQTCLEDWWLPNMCNGEFIFCSYANSHLEGRAILVLAYLLIPSAALLLMLIIHVLVLVFGNFSTIQAQEDVELRRAVRTRMACLLERLQNDQLDGSLWWSRRTLEAKLLFFCSDIVLDMICCVSFFRAEAYAFGGCQLVILAFSGILQLKVGFSNTWKAVCESLRKGLPNNVVHLLLLHEKTFEAPLSLCFQFYAAFYLNENVAAFVVLWVSMLFSIVGIANGIYIYNHLTPFDLDLLEEEEFKSQIPPATMGLPQPNVLGFTTASHQEMVAHPKQKLPPPPGLGFTASRVKAGRKPGQYVSDTEWKWRDFLLEQIDIISPCHLFRHLQRTDVEVSDEQKRAAEFADPPCRQEIFFSQLKGGFFYDQLHFVVPQIKEFIFPSTFCVWRSPCRREI